MDTDNMLKVGIAGFGTIGSQVGRALDRGMAGLSLVAVTTGNSDKAKASMAGYNNPAPTVSPGRLAEMADIIVECAPPSAFCEIVEPALRACRTVVSVSGAAILCNPDIVHQAADGGGKIILASGGMAALDAVRAAAEGSIYAVKMEMRKPPRTLAKDKYILDNGIDIDALQGPLRVFAGTVRDAAKQFPTKVNVAAALALAGIGPDRTDLEVWADPSKTRNTHTIIVDSDSTRFELQIENLPSEENPATGRLAALSVIATLRALGDVPFKVGT